MTTDSFYSHKETLVLNKCSALPPIVYYPGLILFPTRVPGIFQSEHQPQLPPVDGADVCLSALVDTLGAYVKESLEQHKEQLIEQAVLCAEPTSKTATSCPTRRRHFW